MLFQQVRHRADLIVIDCDTGSGPFLSRTHLSCVISLGRALINGAQLRCSFLSSLNAAPDPIQDYSQGLIRW